MRNKAQKQFREQDSFEETPANCLSRVPLNFSLCLSLIFSLIFSLIPHISSPSTSPLLYFPPPSTPPHTHIHPPPPIRRTRELVSTVVWPPEEDYYIHVSLSKSLSLKRWTGQTNASPPTSLHTSLFKGPACGPWIWTTFPLL